jgi:hypothetical protein
VICTPASPHRYPVGETEVTCTATDKAGNTAVGILEVDVTKTSRGTSARGRRDFAGRPDG